MPQHLYDPRTQLNYTIWHEDPTLEKFIIHLIDTVRPDRWVETGTHMGWTCMWIAERYPDLPIYTCEIDPEFYSKSRENLEAHPQISVTRDSSTNFLLKLTPTLKRGTSMFWLDAHWWPPVPLREECRIISKLDRYVCLIDDFFCWKPDFNGDVFFTIPPSGGDAYLNDLSYVTSELGPEYWRPDWQPFSESKGVGLFTKGFEYDGKFMKREDLTSFMTSRSSDRAPHPSMGLWK